MDVSILNLASLQDISFARSKLWGDTLKSLEDRYSTVTEEGLNVSDIEKEFAGEDENDEVPVDVTTEAFEVDVILKDITNSSRLFQKNNTVLSTKDGVISAENKLSMDLLVEDEDAADSDAADQKLLDETLPLLQEHDRRLKEAGIDRILNTFDTKKIDEKVGGWMIRNQSLAANTNVQHNHSQILQKHYQSEYRHHQHRVVCNVPNKTHHVAEHRSKRIVQSDSESESLHSDDMARYVRSSRKQQPNVPKRNASSSTTMTIKTFRLVKSKRDALRHKYKLGRDDDYYEAPRRVSQYPYSNSTHHHQHHHHPVPGKHRPHQQQYQMLAYDDLGLSPGSRRIKKKQSQRIKVLRKRRSSDYRLVNDYDISSSSSASSWSDTSPMRLAAVNYDAYSTDEEDKRDHCKRHYSRHHQYPSSARTHRHNISYTSCCNTKSCNTLPNSHVSRKIMKRFASVKDEDRPSRCEPGCCCTDRRLSIRKSVVLDTSHDEWLEEQCSSPRTSHRSKQLPYTPSKIMQRKEMKREKRQTKTIKNKDITLECEKRPVLAQVTAEDTSDQSDASSDVYLKGVELKHRQAPTTNTQTKVTNIPDKNAKIEEEIPFSDSTDESFDEALALAIEESKKTYQKDLEKSSVGVPSISTKIAKEPNDLKFKAPMKPIRKQQTEQPSPRDEWGEMEKLRKTISRPQPKSMKAKKLKELTKVKEKLFEQNETFQLNANPICNSTAMSADCSAIQRQISATATPKQNEPKQVIASQGANTMPPPPPINTTNGKRRGRSSSKNVADVTSTISTTPPTLSPTVRTKSSVSNNSNSSTSTSSNNSTNDCTIVSSTTGAEPIHTPHGILLYAPNYRILAPAHSFTTNDRFNITLEHMSAIIGEKAARQFMKYYLGRRQFDVNATVYYRPPKIEIDYESNSDDDELERFGQCGELITSPQRVGC